MHIIKNPQKLTTKPERHLTKCLVKQGQSPETVY